MTEHTPDIPLGSWLADLPDERLIRLLELRPDLAQPPPGSIAALAARAQARQSVKAATDDLDFLRLAVLDALLVLQADAEPVPIAKLLALIGDRAPEADVAAALDDLRHRALAWGETAVRVAADAGTALPWHPGQVTLEDRARTGDQIAGPDRRGSTKRNATCWRSCSKGPRWDAPAMPPPAPRRTGRCRSCWRAACCDASTPRR